MGWNQVIIDFEYRGKKLSLRVEIVKQWDDLAGKGSCCQAWRIEFNP